MKPLALFLIAMLFALPLSCAGAEGVEPDSLSVLDIQELRLLRVARDASPDQTIHADVAVIGGGIGGFAAVLALCESGRSVVWTEETDWLGGQFTSQGMSAPDENLFVGSGGSTLSYQEFRREIRDWYRRNRRLSEKSKRQPSFNPGNCWVTGLAFEPHVALKVIETWIHPSIAEKNLRVLKRHKTFRVDREGDRLRALDLLDLERGKILRLKADFFLDATEMGDLWPLAGAEFVIGAESIAETGEVHARPVQPEPDCVQSFTYPFVLEYHAGENHGIAKPEGYENHRESQPYGSRVESYGARGESSSFELELFGMIPQRPGSFWSYRRLIDRKAFAEGEYESDLSLINWPDNDCRRNLLDASPEQMLEMLREARNLSLGFLYWLQTEIPREGDKGYPGLKLNRELLGSADGLSKFPYIREARRALTVETLREQDVSAALNPGVKWGKFFDNSIGIAFYPMDIHAGECEEILPPSETLPFQLPLGMLVPLSMENLIPAGKSAGSTHLTNGCTRLHPVEWALGEAAGVLALTCLAEKLTPREIHGDSLQVRRLQEEIVDRRVPITWTTNISPASPHFRRTQLLPFAPR